MKNHQSISLFAALATVASGAYAGTLTSAVTASGDAAYNWNSRGFGGTSYTPGEVDLGTSSQFDSSLPSSTYYTTGLLEFSIASLAGKTPSQVTLSVYSNGFSTGYYYGSAGLQWVNTGTTTLTGDVVADGVGAFVGGTSIQWTLFNTDTATNLTGWHTFDVTTAVQQDIDAGRAYSTFALTASRDTGGSIKAAESGLGAYLTATVVPEPSSYAAVAAGSAIMALAVRRRRRR